MSIQVVLNVWEQFKVQNPDIFGLQWTLATCFFFIHCLFLMIVFVKVALTSLVCLAKISINQKNYELLRSILVEEGSTLDVIFCNFSCYFLTFENHFANNMSQLNIIFFTNLFVCWFWITLWFKFFYVWRGLEIKLHLQMCF